MNKAAYEIHEMQKEADSPIVDTVVSSDGSWQKRGYDSLNGIVTIIQNDVGKCIDFRVHSKKCNACTNWQKHKGTLEYDKFVAEHECPINHQGFLQLDQWNTNGVVDCFKSSVKNRKLRYVQLIGDGTLEYDKFVAEHDGDSKTYIVFIHSCDMSNLSVMEILRHTHPSLQTLTLELL